MVGPILHLERGLVIQSQDARLPPQVNVVGTVPGDAVPGLAVVAEIVRFRDDGGPPDARVVRVLGVEGSAEVEVAKIKLREGIREEFPEEVLVEARAFGDRVSAKDKRDREDLRDLDLVTIDPVTARDHDDAIFIERSKQRRLPRDRRHRRRLALRAGGYGARRRGRRSAAPASICPTAPSPCCRPS